MFTFHYRIIFIVLIVIGSAIASPMFYIKNENDKYEPGESFSVKCFSFAHNSECVTMGAHCWVKHSGNEENVFGRHRKTETIWRSFDSRSHNFATCASAASVLLNHFSVHGHNSSISKMLKYVFLAKTTVPIILTAWIFASSKRSEYKDRRIDQWRETASADTLQ